MYKSHFGGFNLEIGLDDAQRTFFSRYAAKVTHLTIRSSEPTPPSEYSSDCNSDDRISSSSSSGRLISYPKVRSLSLGNPRWGEFDHALIAQILPNLDELKKLHLSGTRRIPATYINQCKKLRKLTISTWIPLE